MKIQLALSGGIYGNLLLQPIETSDKKIDFPEDLLKFIESPAFQSYKDQADKNDPNQPARARSTQTESETYRLTIFHTPRKASHYDFPKSAFEIDASLKKLVDFIWSTAKPV
ncbi:MAG: hypothetical protein GY801_32435 [bacterium]|nr:hypothetical protein [bacterium]